MTEEFQVSSLDSAEQILVLSAALAIIFFFGSISLIVRMRPRTDGTASMWAMWISVLIVAAFSVITLSGSIFAILNGHLSTLFLLQAFFTVSTGACAVFGLLLLSHTFSHLRRELRRRQELEKINAEHQSGMEKMILERTANLRQEILGRQVLNKKLIAQNRSMESDLRLAGTLQRALMPTEIQFPYVRAAIQYHPLGIVSGDFYDRISNDRGDVYLFCGDAMGHGTPAALFTFMLSAALRSADRNSRPSQILERINQALITRNLELYATGVLVRIQPTGQVTIAHAGHDSAILLRSSGEFEEAFQKSGFALGMFDDEFLNFEDEVLMMKPGDRLILHTDGITEAADASGSRFGLSRLKDCLREQMQEPLEHAAASVIEAVYDHIDEQPMRDDMTVMVIEFGESHG